jgi:hypothetical protein
MLRVRDPSPMLTWLVHEERERRVLRERPERGQEEPGRGRAAAAAAAGPLEGVQHVAPVRQLGLRAEVSRPLRHRGGGGHPERVPGQDDLRRGRPRRQLVLYN